MPIEQEVAELRERIKSLNALLIEKLLEGGNPISPNCEKILASSPDCGNFRAIRRWAACQAWKVMDEQMVGWRLGITQGWAKARDSCTRE